MKKILALMLAIVMILSLAACTKEGQPAASNENGQTAGGDEDKTISTSSESEENNSSAVAVPETDATQSSKQEVSSTEPEVSSSEETTTSKKENNNNKGSKNGHSHNEPWYSPWEFGSHLLSGYRDCKASICYVAHNVINKCEDKDANYRCDLCNQFLMNFQTQFDSNGSTGIYQFEYGIDGLEDPAEFDFYIDDQLVYHGPKTRHNFLAYLMEPGEHILIIVLYDKNGKEIIRKLKTCTIMADEIKTQ